MLHGYKRYSGANDDDGSGYAVMEQQSNEKGLSTLLFCNSYKVKNRIVWCRHLAECKKKNWVYCAMLNVSMIGWFVQRNKLRTILKWGFGEKHTY
jgi:hypothetical protein